MNKIKCQIHNQLSFGQVGSNNVCILCDCKNMVYCQNMKNNEIQNLIEQRIQNRGEIKRLQIKKFQINNAQMRLETQYNFQNQGDQISKLLSDRDRKIEQVKILHEQIIQKQENQLNQRTSQIKKSIKSNEQMLLSAFEKLCTYYLETTITNAEFVIYHFSRRKQWKIVDAMEIKDACIQHVHDDLGLNIHCQLVGNLTTKNKPIQGYYIVFIQSLIYDGYWKNGHLIDGTISYIQPDSSFLSYDPSEIMNSSQKFAFNGIKIFYEDCLTFYHSIDDHLSYIQTNNMQFLQNRNHYLQNQ